MGIKLNHIWSTFWAQKILPKLSHFVANGRQNSLNRRPISLGHEFCLYSATPWHFSSRSKFFIRNSICVHLRSSSSLCELMMTRFETRVENPGARQDWAMKPSFSSFRQTAWSSLRQSQPKKQKEEGGQWFALSLPFSHRHWVSPHMTSYWTFRTQDISSCMTHHLSLRLFFWFILM